MVDNRDPLGEFKPGSLHREVSTEHPAVISSLLQEHGFRKPLRRSFQVFLPQASPSIWFVCLLCICSLKIALIKLYPSSNSVTRIQSQLKQPLDWCLLSRYSFLNIPRLLNMATLATDALVRQSLRRWSYESNGTSASYNTKVTLF